MALVLVDAENVRRSLWPNLGREELVALAGRWGESHGHEVVVVFDGRAPEGAVGSGDVSADDWIAARAAELAQQGTSFWLATSDRELRARAGGGAQRTIGGGALARELAALRRPEGESARGDA